jgi:hypothetical protein
MFSHSPPLNAARQYQIHPLTARSVAAAAGVNGSAAAATPTSRPAATIVQRRTPSDAGRMNRFDSRLSAIVACSWIPGIVPCSLPKGVEKASERPDTASPTRTSLSLNTDGSTSGVSCIAICSADASRWRTS